MDGSALLPFGKENWDTSRWTQGPQNDEAPIIHSGDLLDGGAAASAAAARRALPLLLLRAAAASPRVRAHPAPSPAGAALLP